MQKKKFDFGGYLTRYNVKCTDGRTILKDAFKDCDGMVIPMVWQHMHDEPGNVLGNLLLEHRDDGVYAWGTFNSSKSGQEAKVLVEHRDVRSLSAYANSLIEKTKNVIHGVIREGSLVLAGANPGAKIDYLSFEHMDGTSHVSDEDAIIWSADEISLEIEAADTSTKKEEVKHADDEEETLEDILDTLTDKQKDAVYAMIGGLVTDEDEEGEAAQSDIKHQEGDGKVMKKNVFDSVQVTKDYTRPVLTPQQFMEVMDDAKKMGSLKQSVMAHAGTYGIDNIDYLFPDAQAVTDSPTFISRKMEWVGGVINGAKHSPFSRIKSIHADITVETARALGYVTGALKKEEVFGLLRRTTTPTTIYKKQKLDRDDIIDITSFDVVAWLKAEMRVLLDEEIARASLVSDGRDPVTQAEDKIDETSIRSVWKDANLYSHHHFMAAGVTDAEVMDHAVRARNAYRGSGSPTLYVGPTILTEWMLLKDNTGRRLYATEAELASAMRVSSIVEVGLFDSLSREVDPLLPDGPGGSPTLHNLLGIILNMRDYTMGADRGGQISFFDDFDIDYNQQKYLLEGRMSGCLVQPKSAIVLERAAVPG